MRSILAVFSLVIIFLLFIAAGFFGRQVLDKQTQASKPGWCCMMQQKQCVVQKDLETCTGAGGVAFNWDKTVCTNICR